MKWCAICKNGYDDIDQLEYHLTKEHTKSELIHYLKMISNFSWQEIKEIEK